MIISENCRKIFRRSRPYRKGAVAAMQRIGRQFPDCGYGRKFYQWMFDDDPRPYNRCGNGSAMRISPVGFAAGSVEQAKEMSAAVTRVSHNHPEGLKGAEATAVAIVLARQGNTKDEIRKYIEENYKLCDKILKEMSVQMSVQLEISSSVLMITVML